MTEQQKQGFSAFGDKPFVCPAKEAFGPRMVGLLIAAFVKGLAGEGWKVLLFPKEGGNGGGVEIEGGEVLESDREAYERVELVKKGESMMMGKDGVD